MMCREKVVEQQMVQKHPSRFQQKMCPPFVNGLPKMWMIDTGPHQQHLILYQVPGRPEVERPIPHSLKMEKASESKGFNGQLLKAALSLKYFEVELYA